MSLLLLAGIVAVLFFLYGKSLYLWASRRKHIIDLAERLPGPPAYPIIGNMPQVPQNSYGMPWQDVEA